MLQFYLSNTLASDMKMHITEPLEINPAALQWYGHRVTIMRRKCVLMMENKSRYCMVFAGLTKPDFENFPDLFMDRLWREAVSICQLDDRVSKILAESVHIIGEQQHYQIGSDRSIQAHLRQVTDDIDYMVNYKTGRLPEHGEEEFGCGIRVNETLRKRKGDKDYFVPLEVFRDFWLGLVDHSQKNKATDNVLPFRRKQLGKPD